MIGCSTLCRTAPHSAALRKHVLQLRSCGMQFIQYPRFRRAGETSDALMNSGGLSKCREIVFMSSSVRHAGRVSSCSAGDFCVLTLMNSKNNTGTETNLQDLNTDFLHRAD